MAAATDSNPIFRGVVTIGGERARELRKGPAPVRAGDLVGHSGEFHAGDWLYVTSRGHDGGQSVLAMGKASIDFDRIDGLDALASVVDKPELLWRQAAAGA